MKLLVADIGGTNARFGYQKNKESEIEHIEFFNCVDFKNIDKFSKNEIAICPENTAAISIGTQSIHLTDFKVSDYHLQLKGHSVMMGYLDNELNKSSFKSKALLINL